MDPPPARRGSRRRSAVLAAFVALVAVGALACSGDEPTSTPAPTATATRTATAVASSTPAATPGRALATAVAQARITTDDLNVRTGPDLAWPVIGQLQTGDEVPVAGRNVEGEWLAILDAGWVFHDPGWMDIDLPLLSLPVLNEAQVVGPMQPAATTTGIDPIDKFVRAVTAGDLDALVSAAVFLTLDCATNPGGVGGPPTCGAGVEDGTPVEVFPVATCEVGYVETAELRPHLQLALAGPAGAGARLALYAVVLADDAQPDTFPRGAWALIFADSTGLGRAFFLDDDGHFVQLWVGCDASAPLTLTRDLDPARWVLPPVVPEGLRPPP